MGEFVKQVLDFRHINYASVAREMGVRSTAFQSYFNSKSIADSVLLKMTDALKFDLYGMVQDELARRTNTVRYKQPSGESSHVKEADVPYQRSTGRGGPDITIHLVDYDEATQLQILRFLQQQPMLGRSAYTSKSGS